MNDDLITATRRLLDRTHCHYAGYYAPAPDTDDADDDDLDDPTVVYVELPASLWDLAPYVQHHGHDGHDTARLVDADNLRWLIVSPPTPDRPASVQVRVQLVALAELAAHDEIAGRRS